MQNFYKMMILVLHVPSGRPPHLRVNHWGWEPGLYFLVLRARHHIPHKAGAVPGRHPVGLWFTVLTSIPDSSETSVRGHIPE